MPRHRSRTNRRVNKPKVFTSTAEEIAYINQARQTIDEKIRLLEQQKAHFGRRLNQLQSSSRNLPSEILSEIFRIHHESVFKQHGPLFQLLSVCYHWYETGRSTPRLWSTLSCSILDHFRIDEKSKYLLQFFNNAGTVPVTLMLTNHCENLNFLGSPPWKDNITKVRSLFFIEFVSLRCVMSEIFLESFGNLEELELYGTHLRFNGHATPTETNNITLNLTKLRMLTLSEWSCHCLTLPTSQKISTLRLHGVSLFISMHLLSQCQHSLTALEITPETYSDTSINLTATLHNLQTLIIRRFGASTGMIHLIKNLKFPVLRRLILEVNSSRWRETPDLLVPFLRELPDIPVTMRVITGDMQGEWLTTFDNANRVQELILVSPLPKCVKDTLELLTPHASLNISDSDVEFRLPNLQRLAIRSESSDVWLDALLEMMERRKVGLEKPFQLIMVKLETLQMDRVYECVETLKKEGSCKVYVQPVGRDDDIFG